MTSREKGWLAAGILVGALASAGATAFYLKGSGSKMAQAPSVPAVSDSVSQETPAETGGLEEAAQLRPEEQAKIGIEVTAVRRESIVEDIAAIGRVEEPETAISTVSTRYGGRVERLFVKFAGQPVQKDDPIATIAITGQPVGKDDPFGSIYSRDLIAAAEEYKFALENRQHAHAISRPEAQAQADALVEASRVRLQRWGVTPDQIDGVLARPEQPIRVTVNAGTSGIVRSRKVSEGQFVNAGDPLVELTDLKTIWVKADVFDADLARIRPGMSATLTSEALPGLKLTGEVDFIDPHSNPQTRTTPVRIQVENPDTRLKPGMIVQSAFRIAMGTLLTVPRDSVIDSGEEKVVYVVRDNGVFQKRRIQVGAPVKDRYPVTSGLQAGEKVVTNGVFLVDSQTRLSGGMTGLFGGSKSFSEGPSAPAPGANYKISFRIDPDPPMGTKENTLHVSVLDTAGKPVNDAQVRLTFVMPAMPSMKMPEMRNSADLKWTGTEYTGPIQIIMAGGWNVSIEARRGNEVLATTQTRVNAR